MGTSTLGPLSEEAAQSPVTHSTTKRTVSTRQKIHTDKPLLFGMPVTTPALKPQVPSTGTSEPCGDAGTADSPGVRVWCHLTRRPSVGARRRGARRAGRPWCPTGAHSSPCPVWGPRPRGTSLLRPGLHLLGGLWNLCAGQHHGAAGGSGSTVWVNQRCHRRGDRHSPGRAHLVPSEPPLPPLCPETPALYLRHQPCIRQARRGG